MANNKGPNYRNFHAVQGQNGWVVKQEGNQSPVSIHNTQAEAWNRAIQNAKSYEGEAFKHGRDGTIKERNTYKPGDPYPPKG